MSCQRVREARCSIGCGCRALQAHVSYTGRDSAARAGCQGAAPGQDGAPDAAKGPPHAARLLAAYLDLLADCRLSGGRVRASTELRGLRVETHLSVAGPDGDAVRARAPHIKKVARLAQGSRCAAAVTASWIVGRQGRALRYQVSRVPALAGAWPGAPGGATRIAREGGRAARRTARAGACRRRCWSRAGWRRAPTWPMARATSRRGGLCGPHAHRQRHGLRHGLRHGQTSRASMHVQRRRVPQMIRVSARIICQILSNSDSKMKMHGAAQERSAAKARLGAAP